MAAPAPTIKDVARLSGVSYKTVSRVINGEAAVSTATRARVEAAIATTGYRPHVGARGLRLGRLYSIRLQLRPDIQRFLSNPYLDDIVGSVVDVAADRGYTVTIDLPDRRRPAGAGPLVADLFDGRSDGTILLDSELTGSHAARLASTGAPVVVIANRDLLPSLSWVDVDFFGGAVLLVEHLLGLGHRHIAYLTDRPYVRSTTERERGIRTALAAAGLTLDSRLVVYAGQLRHEGDQATARLLATGQPFTAIICNNDLTALGAIDCLTRHGRRVPADVSVTGYDDIDLARYAVPPLTTIHIPWYPIGETATTVVLDLIEGKRQAPARDVFPVHLVVRGSTAPPPGRS